MYCPGCGEPHLSDTERCPVCGCSWRERLASAPTPVAFPLLVDDRLVAEVARIAAAIEALSVPAVRRGRLRRCST